MLVKKMDDLLENRCSDLNTAISRLSRFVGTRRTYSAEDVVQRTEDAAYIALFTVRQPSVSRGV